MIQYTPDRWANYREEFGRETSARMCQLVEDNPKSALMLGFGLGFGAGLVLAAVLMNSADDFEREESFSEKLTGRIADSLGAVLPTGWKNPLR